MRSVHPLKQIIELMSYGRQRIVQPKGGPYACVRSAEVGWGGLRASRLGRAPLRTRVDLGRYRRAPEHS